MTTSEGFSNFLTDLTTLHIIPFVMTGKDLLMTLVTLGVDLSMTLMVIVMIFMILTTTGDSYVTTL